jgi:hypothetical protein
MTRAEHNALISRISALSNCAADSPEWEELLTLAEKWKEVGVPPGGYDVSEPVMLKAMIALAAIHTPLPRQ